MTATYEPVTCRGGAVTNRMVTREKDNGVEGRKGGVVEKLHPAHCIENLNEEEEEKEKGRVVEVRGAFLESSGRRK